jgi:8-oxo-dGTP pyrophosphatase MutT (NUDIX family)
MESRIIPPHGVAREAELGLYLHKLYKRGGLTKSQAKKEGINSGVERAKQLANRKTLSVEDVKSMYRFFKRHSAFKKHHKEEPPSNALISWKLWGGDAGEKWIMKEYKKLKMNEVKKLKPLKVKDMMIDQPETTTKKGLQAKAKEHGIDYQILKKVFMRGLRAWDKSQDKLPKGTNRYQWAYDRVNDFLKGQGTAKGVDKKLAFKAGIISEAKQLIGILESTLSEDDMWTDDGYWGTGGASGVLVIAKDTGRILLAKRSYAVDQPGTWGNIGGAIQRGRDGEYMQPLESAKNEFEEEAGRALTGATKFVPIYVFQDGSFQYFNYLAIVPNEFNPKPNWETEYFEWFTLPEFLKLPKKHFGIQSIINDSKSMRAIRRYAK